MLAAADWFLTVVHLAVIVGFVALWIPRATVRIHRIVVALTASSWLLLGLRYGFGYCALTDLQWHVKRARGATHLPSSFLKYVGDFVTGTDIPSRLIDRVAGVVFVLGVGAALYRYVEERRAAAPR